MSQNDADTTAYIMIVTPQVEENVSPGACPYAKVQNPHVAGQDSHKAPYAILHLP